MGAPLAKACGMRHLARNVGNQRTGQASEVALAFAAGAQGVLAIRNGQKVRWLPGGRMVAVKSNLDWTLVYQGKPVFADQKTFKEKRFGASLLDARQIDVARQYVAHGAQAGFIVCLRGADTVLYLPVEDITGGRQGFGPDAGVRLGTSSLFDLLPIWRRELPTSTPPGGGRAMPAC